MPTVAGHLGWFTVTQRSGTLTPHRFVFALLGVISYGSLVLWTTMKPQLDTTGFRSGVKTLLEILHRRGLPEWFGFNELEAVANVGMFVPLGFFITLLFAGNRQWIAIFLLPLISAVIETVQWLFLPNRVADPFDILHNSLGGWIGFFLAVILRALIHHRDRGRRSNRH